MTTQGTTVEARTLKVPGATLYVEVQGSGPVLLCITGGPTDAGMFTDLAGRLADRYTVVTYDQRGHSRSTLDGEPGNIPVALHADDAAAILEVAGDTPAHVYGNSGGGTIGLELMTRKPELVRTLLAHEPPLIELLPDAERWRSTLEHISEAYYELRPIGGYVPDFDALRDVSTRIVSAAGENSGEQMARRAAAALAERLHIGVTYLPGAHGGWGSDPHEFANRLHEALNE
jgi:pimeloyl-ACP methyl ester carboxylesterase